MYRNLQHIIKRKYVKNLTFDMLSSIINSKKGGSMSNKKNTKMGKFWSILLTLVLLSIPMLFLNGIIGDRMIYKAEAVNKISNSWGGEQVLKAPSMTYQAKEAQQLKLNDYNVNVEISTELRKKGIFKVPVYTANVILSGDFDSPANLNGKVITTGFEISDSKGLLESPTFIINNQTPASVSDIKYSTTLNSTKNKIPFEIRYKLRGVNCLYATLNGESNKIHINGNWKDPSFEGDFLPLKREVNKKNFAAEWSIPKIATINNSNNVNRVGVSLLTPVDNYRMAERALKYAFLFLSLTFGAYFIYEIISRDEKKIHPLQYLMLGGAMLIFYLLLVSLSEFVPFILAYILASFMIISLIGTYTYFAVCNKTDKTFSYIISLLMTLLYILLYVILSLQDFALLIGSISLFIVMALIMYVTRNVEWYNSETKEPD